MRYLKIVFLLAICASFGAAFVLTRHAPVASCTPIPQQAPEIGNHGWHVWSSDTFMSFTPDQTGYCIESGWEPIGATFDTAGNALFPDGSSGIVITSNAFTAQQLLLSDNETSIRVLYPAHLEEADVIEYLAIINRVFGDVGALYKNFETTRLSGHVIFISEGVAGDATTVETSVYPTPTKDVTVFARNKNHPRGEELFIHAVTHLFNRHFAEGLVYQENQAPVPATDWQELESSWAEIAFLSDHEGRQARVDDLYEVHKAVMSGVFSPELEYPFNTASTYEEVRRTSVILDTDSTYAETQYSHYVLAPLLLVSIDGLLQKQSTSTSVHELIQTARTENKNFFVLLQEHLSQAEMAQINDYIFGRDSIPYELLAEGMRRYEQ